MTPFIKKKSCRFPTKIKLFHAIKRELDDLEGS